MRRPNHFKPKSRSLSSTIGGANLMPSENHHYYSDSETFRINLRVTYRLGLTTVQFGQALFALRGWHESLLELIGIFVILECCGRLCKAHNFIYQI